MGPTSEFNAVRVLPEELANKIAAGEVVERPASVVKELVENALDAGASRVTVRLVAAGRRTIEVIDNGRGMSQQDAMLAIERHATSKIRAAEDLDSIQTLGFRGEALPSIGAVSRMEILTRRASDEAATRLRIDGGVLRDVAEASGAPGTRVTVNRLYFNTPVRAKFLKGVTTELGHCIDTVQRYALAWEGVAFQCLHNDKVLLDIPENAGLRDRVALIWGLNFVSDMAELEAERAGLRVRGLIGTPALTRSSRSHQFFFLNRRPIVNRALQYGFQDGYHGLITVGRYPVGVLLIDMNPRFVDVNIHPSKREVRFRDDRAVQEALRDMTRTRLETLRALSGPLPPSGGPAAVSDAPRAEAGGVQPRVSWAPPVVPGAAPSVQSEFAGAETFAAPEDDDDTGGGEAEAAPAAMFAPLQSVGASPLQLFDTYLLVPEEDRLLIIDQHALHERLSYDSLRAELSDADHGLQQLAVPLLVDVAPSQIRLLEDNLPMFGSLGIEIEHFGANTYQVTAVCHLYEESRIPDAIFRVLDQLAQTDLFDKDEFVSDFLRLTVEACRGAVKAGDRLTPEERKALIQGFRYLRPPYTCPHGRPIVTEITQLQMEKSFRRRP